MSFDEVVKIEATRYERFAIDVANYYVNDMEAGIKKIVGSLPYRFCILDCYNNLQEKGLVIIDKLDAETKKELWEKSFEWQPESIPTTTRTAICKCIWLLTFTLDKYFV